MTDTGNAVGAVEILKNLRSTFEHRHVETVHAVSETPVPGEPAKQVVVTDIVNYLPEENMEF